MLEFRGPSQFFGHARRPAVPRYGTNTPFSTILLDRVHDSVCLMFVVPEYISWHIEVPCAPLCTCQHVRFAFQTRQFLCEIVTQWLFCVAKDLKNTDIILKPCISGSSFQRRAETLALCEANQHGL